MLQYQGEPEFQRAGIRKPAEDLKQGANAEIGPKDFFEAASIQSILPLRKYNDTMRAFKGIAIVFCIALLGCGGSAVRIDGELDSPSQHVITGNQLLEVGKLGGALREFDRALELAPRYIPAYVGLSDTYGAMGQFSNGLEYLSEAERLAQSAEDKALVKQGIERLRQMMEKTTK